MSSKKRHPPSAGHRSQNSGSQYPCTATWFTQCNPAFLRVEYQIWAMQRRKQLVQTIRDLFPKHSLSIERLPRIIPKTKSGIWCQRCNLQPTTLLRKMSQKQLQGVRIWVPVTLTLSSWGNSDTIRHNGFVWSEVPLNPMVYHGLRWFASRTFIHKSYRQVQGTLASWITAAVVLEDQTLWSRF
jgi:hypothetical protein